MSAPVPKSFRCPPALAQKLSARARELDRPESWVILRALEAALDGPDKALARVAVRSTSPRLGNVKTSAEAKAGVKAIPRGGKK